MSRRRRSWWWLLATVAAAQAAEPIWQGSGPLWYPNGHPFHAVFLDQPLLDPVLPKRVRLEAHVSESNTLALSDNVRATPAWSTLQSNLAHGQAQTTIDTAGLRTWAAAHPDQTLLFADTETTRVSLAATVPLGRRWGLRTELPLVGHWGGFLDEAIKGWHRAFNFPDLGRSYTPSYHTQLFVARGNQSRTFDGASELDLGDLVCRGLYAPLVETRRSPAVMLVASVKAPTGAASKFVGSGRWEGGLACAAAKSFGSFRPYLGAGYTWHSKWSGLTSLPIANTLELHAGLEMRIDRRWSWQVQFSRQEQALAKAEPDSFGRAAWRVGAAGHYRASRETTLEWAFSENFTEHANTEDISIQTGVRWAVF